MRLFIRHRCCFHPPCRDSATTWSNQSGPAGCLTRLQRSLYATARIHCSLCPARAFTSELALPMSPSNSVGYDYVGNSQFPRLIFHQQDKQPYGLHARVITPKHTSPPSPFRKHPTGHESSSFSRLHSSTAQPIGAPISTTLIQLSVPPNEKIPQSTFFSRKYLKTHFSP